MQVNEEKCDDNARSTFSRSPVALLDETSCCKGKGVLL